MSWTLRKSWTIICGSKRDQEERGLALDPQESPGKIKNREMELGSESWTTFCFSFSSTIALRTLSL